MTRRSLTGFLTLALFMAIPLHAASNHVRPSTWAKPAFAAHVKNFYRLDSKVYRSAQPSHEGFRELERLGIRNVLSFRDYYSDAQAATGTVLKLFRIKMETGDIETGQVIQALQVIKDADGPILIHDWHGTDRTGLISALYRIVFQGWSKEGAIDELMNGGYGYQPMYKNLLDYIRKADIDTIKRGIK